MDILLILVFVIIAAVLIGTLALAGKGDSDYTSATKGNVTRLTLIYIALTVILVVGLGIYIFLI
ncbi:hypothetical protein [Mesobacillus harenae]|uniref:hypothetical protein n=1 Tax=Mesobacillus harenae TaxID=2213203 RepID=UPI0015801F7A|nr:hypothetical protein [Mesobacillus harenae]